jgi:hypothetical protein
VAFAVDELELGLHGAKEGIVAFCTGCGKELPAGAAACPACGQGATVAPVSSASLGGLTDNMAAALVYIPFIGALIGLIFLLTEPYSKNRALRFHCFQSLFFALACWSGSSCY